VALGTAERRAAADARLWDACVGAAGSAGEWARAAGLHEERRAMGHATTPREWDTLVGAMASSGRMGEALEAYGAMVGLGLAPTKYTFTSLLACASRAGEAWRCDDLWEERARHKVEPSAHLACSYVVALGEAGEPRRAAEYARRWPREEGRTEVHNGALRGLCAAGHVREALELFDEMQEKGALPDATTFRALVPAAYDAGLPAEARRLEELAASLQALGLV